MSIPSLEQIEREFKERMERRSDLLSRAVRASSEASHLVSHNKDRDLDSLHELTQELARIVVRLAEELR